MFVSLLSETLNTIEPIMPIVRWFALFFVVAAGTCFSQTSPQNPTSMGISVDCSDPFQASSPECSGAELQSASGAQRGQSAPSASQIPRLRNPFGAYEGQYPPRTIPLNPSQVRQPNAPTWPETEFEQMAADSAGRPLPLFGQSLFDQAPSTFAPMDLLQVPSDYIIGPGDELQIRIWGQLEADLRTTVDRSGQIYIPRVGQISVAGVHYGELEPYLKNDISKIFRNFNITVNVGQLRSIQILVVGNARYPGTYTISSLSTLVNAIFASGGPTPQGSLRHIQVRRDGATITDFDFYDLLIKGDKSKDVRLQPGDVLYIPPVGPLAAISGSVNTPAIYELKGASTLNELIEIAGGLSSLADTGRITIERVAEHQARKTLEFPYDDSSRALALQDGDIVRVFSIVPSFQDTVTLRGNVANPGRYPWKPGMRVSDLIPTPEALLTRRYWLERAAIGNGHATEYPVRPGFNVRCLPTGQQSNSPSQSGTQPAVSTTNAPANGTQSTTGNTSNSGAMDSAGVTYIPCEPVEPQPSNGTSQNVSDRTPLGSQQRPEVSEEMSLTQRTAKSVTADLRRYAPEINWEYAIIQRVNPADLTSKLLWLSPRKAIIEHDEASNLELQPGDIVTIFSQRDISLPEDERSRYAVVEGEVQRPGVYKLEKNETLHSVLQRAGGLTPNAYIYGSQLLRESARVEQQNSLDQLASTMEVQVRQSALAVAASASGGDAQALAQLQQGIISQLRTIRATGRVSLPVKPSDKNLADFPNMLMEDNDRLVIPHTPSTVSVVGNVYNPGSFIFDPHTNSGAYLVMAGRGKPQSDLHHAFVLRANGVVVAANNVNGLFTGSKFDHLRLYPGDEIVVPYKLPTGAFVRGLQQWTQISSQLAITAAALAVVH
jgi:protein involved in polysaccharide export with SLBB domain